MTETFRCDECGMVADVPQIEFNFCPGCGVLGSHWNQLCSALLTLYGRDGRLADALHLFRKAAYPDAARAALISVEMEMKRLGATESYGNQLVDEVLSFEFDNKENRYLREPLIKINDLSSQSDRGEQDGIRLLIAGMFKGLRNTLMHQHVKFNAIHALSVVVMSDLLIDILNRGSIAKERICVWRRVSPAENASE